ncbi:putative MFS-type transporter YfcJ [Methylobacterium soli]|nr:putative MFS-type transporter YfcJ [Methylobacterium soli]
MALVCLLIQAADLMLMRSARSATVAAAGAPLSGLGYALVFPGFGDEVVRRARPQIREFAVGANTANLDFALDVAGRSGLEVLFLAGAVSASCAALASPASSRGRRPPPDIEPSFKPAPRVTRA